VKTQEEFRKALGDILIAYDKYQNTPEEEEEDDDDDALQEGRQRGILYHATSFEGATGILQSNEIHGESRHFVPDPTDRAISKAHGAKDYRFVSFTRSRE